MELYIPACIPADLKNCTHESPRALSHNETHAAMCCRKPRHLQKHHSPSEIVHPTRRFLSLPSASKLYLKKLQIFLLHLTHMIHHEFYVIPLYLYLLLPRIFFLQILRKKSSLSWTTVAGLHHIHDLVRMKPTKPQLDCLHLLRICMD